MAPGNTIESFEAALEHGVDMIEFDVLRTPDGRLVLAHDGEDAAGPGAAHPRARDSTTSRARPTPGWSSTSTSSCPATSARWWTAWRERDLARALAGLDMFPESLDRLGELAPGPAPGLVGAAGKRNWVRSPFAVPAYAVARVMRARLPGQAAARIRAGGCEAIMSHQILAAAGWCRPCTAPADRSTCGPWTTPPGSPRWRAWAWTA